MTRTFDSAIVLSSSTVLQASSFTFVEKPLYSFYISANEFFMEGLLCSLTFKLQTSETEFN
jgi:hypothetical protein